MVEAWDLEKFREFLNEKYERQKGFLISKKYETYKDDVINFEIRDSDVIVVGFPKTGTNWTQEMVWLLANNLDYEGAQVPLHERFPWFECQFFNFPKHVTYQEHLFNSIDYISKLKQRRFIKTHLPWCLLPKQIQNGQRKPKIICTSRNPKDVCISYLNQVRMMLPVKLDFEDFYPLFLADKLMFTPFWDHVRQFWDRKDEENILFLNYEQMKIDLRSVIRRTAKFLDVNIRDKELEKLHDYLSIESMRKNPAVNFEDFPMFQLGLEKISFLKNGKVGRYKEVMSKEIEEEFDKWIEEYSEKINLRN